jgi:hypothetical protein
MTSWLVPELIDARFAVCAGSSVRSSIPSHSVRASCVVTTLLPPHAFRSSRCREHVCRLLPSHPSPSITTTIRSPATMSISVGGGELDHGQSFSVSELLYAAKKMLQGTALGKGCVRRSPHPYLLCETFPTTGRDREC